ncbi:MAG: universal stress protein [Planctomycetes bacterium]|nr:universal stress protein [Planctomycetota bacterium]
MIRSILVPLDGSTFGEHALPLAMSMARRLEASLNLIHVHTLLEATYAELQVFDNTLDQELRSKERAYLQAVQKKVQDRLSVPVTIRNVDGDIATVIREQAESQRADWVVMTTHARGPFGRFWLGSVADELVRSLPMSLILVHPEAHAPDLTVEPVPKHLLIPLDGTPLAEQILEPAVTFGRAMQADYTLLRALTPVYPAMVPAEPAIFGSVAGDIMERVERAHAELKKEADTYLNKTADRLRGEQLNVQTRIVFEDQPGVAILDAARAPIDMIAIETHGRGGLSRLLLGSVADKVIRGSKLPVLVHKPTL